MNKEIAFDVFLFMGYVGLTLTGNSYQFVPLILFLIYLRLTYGER